MPKKTSTANDLIGVAEASDITGLDRRTLHRKVERGELVAVSKLPGLRGAYIFNRSAILALHSQSTPSSATPRPDEGVSFVPAGVAAGSALTPEPAGTATGEERAS